MSTSLDYMRKKLA